MDCRERCIRGLPALPDGPLLQELARVEQSSVSAMRPSVRGGGPRMLPQVPF